MKKILVLLLLLCIPLFSYSQKINDLYAFELCSGNGKVFTNDDLIGKLTLCFYETKDTSNINLDLKKVLSQYDEQIKQLNSNISLLAIANCTSLSAKLFRGIWEKGLISKSLSEGYTIYGDWDGTICRRYSLEPEKTNFIIIDPAGNILYQNCGYINELEIPNILRILGVE